MHLLTNSVEGPDLSNVHYKTGKLNFSFLFSFPLGSFEGEIPGFHDLCDLCRPKSPLHLLHVCPAYQYHLVHHYIALLSVRAQGLLEIATLGLSHPCDC